MTHKLDTDKEVFFYEQEFYVLSNFSSFRVRIWGNDFMTAEHAYHWKRFAPANDFIGAFEAARAVFHAPSAHEAFTIAQRNKPNQRPDWDMIKTIVMRLVLMEKVQQHEYVRRKLLETGDRVLIEDSWRDPFWGWGPDRNGQNMLGKIWMDIRASLRLAQDHHE